MEGDRLVRQHPGDEEPFAALAFKIATDPFVGRLCFLRIYSGVLKAGDTVLNVRTGKRERINRLFQMHANKQNSVPRVEAGDIAAGVGFKDIRTGDTLCDEKNKIVLEIKDSIAILILVERVRNPDMELETLSEILSKQGVYIKPETIGAFFSYHRIEKKSQLSRS